MEITEIRIKLMEGSEDRLRAFCSITIDHSFVVRDLKIIDGSHGPFVAMPSRKLTGHCNRCGSKNHLRAGYCNQCGAKLHGSNYADTPQKLYADVAHPINSECREMIQNAVIEEFNAELQRSAQPNYRSRYDDDFDAGDYDEADYTDARSEAPAAARTATSEPAAPPAASAQTEAAREEVPFAAGIFDAHPPQRADDAKHELDAPNLTSPVASSPPAGTRDDEVSAEEDAVLVRGESGVQHTIPRPHFRDRPGGSSRPKVGSPSSRDSDDVKRTARNRDTDDSDFGAGIFDD